MEGFLCYDFGGLIFRGAYTWRAYMYFRNTTLCYLRIMLCSRKTPFLLGLPDRVSFPHLSKDHNN